MVRKPAHLSFYHDFSFDRSSLKLLPPRKCQNANWSLSGLFF